MTGRELKSVYFRHAIPISARQWQALGLDEASSLIGEHRLPRIVFYRQLALSLNRGSPAEMPPVYASHLNMYAVLQSVFRFMIDTLAEDPLCGVLEMAVRHGGYAPEGSETLQTLERFVALFPPAELLGSDVQAAKWLRRGTLERRMALRELLLLSMGAKNPAADSFRSLFDDLELAQESAYRPLAAATHGVLAETPFVIPLGRSLGEALWAPIRMAPASLADQIRFVRDTWSAVLPHELLEEIATALDILLEEEREWGDGGDPGPPPVLEFRGGGGQMRGRGDSIFGGFDYPEYERYSPDADWMSNVVLMAKMASVWLDQLSRSYGRLITRLDQIPDAELDRLASWGFTGLWLIGIWERSPASRRIKQICGNPEANASAYSLYDYDVAADLGGWEALALLRDRAAGRGIRLASDMVPNHTGIYSRWVVEHPQWFVQSDYPPFPTYRFSGENLSPDDRVSLQIEDGYWSRHDAAVVFKHVDRRDGRTRYIYHGNDGTSTPWNDTAQLNYLIPEVREAVIRTILHVAHTFPIIRFDAAMTLAKKHYQRLWFPLRGLGGGIPSRAEHGMSKEEFDTVFPVEFWREVVDRVAAEAPGTLLLAEAFWMMEGYFVRTLGMHRVYNSAFMNMLKMEENHKYRQTIKNVLEFDPEVLKRFVNFMNNPDERTAVEQFGTQDKYFGACVLLATMPGLPMFGHGQIEGFHEKYGMEYKRAYWDEQIDEGLVAGHELWIFPLLRHRWLFSGSEHFMLYDFYACDCVNENVFAYSNRGGEQRSLVLYHNSFSTAAGWIRDSSGFAVKNGGSEAEIHRSTLGRALGLSGAEGSFCVFRDHITGLTYLRNGRELSECGLYVELKEYQFHVFLDFREIHDDSWKNWSRLDEALGGRGVENLDDELKQLQYGPLNEAFRKLIRAFREHPATGGDQQEGPAVQWGRHAFTAGSMRNFFAEMGRLAVVNEIAAASAQQRQERLATLLGVIPADVEGAAFYARLTALLEATDSCSVLMAWMLLAGMNPGVLAQFGLDCTLRRLLESADASQRLCLLAPLLSLWDESADDGADSGAPPSGIFSSTLCRDYIEVHQSRGVEWFNKERFEELEEWLAIIRLIDTEMPPLPAAAVTTAMTKTEQALRFSYELAAHAGYRAGLYQRMEAAAADQDYYH